MEVRIPNPIKCPRGFWIIPIYRRREYEEKDKVKTIDEELYWTCTYLDTSKIKCSECPATEAKMNK